MNNPLLMSVRVLLAATAIAALVMSPAASQALLQQTTAAKLGKERPWTPPHTPWGDPDLRGTFSNGDEYTTPLERPDRFAGRRLEDIKGEELVNVRRTQLQQ